MTKKYGWPKYLNSTFNTWPKYVRIHEKHGDTMYLVKDTNELIELMVQMAREFFGKGYFGEADWYFNGTYEAYFFDEMCMTVEDYQNSIAGNQSPAFSEIKRTVSRLPQRHRDETQALYELNYVEQVCILRDIPPTNGSGVLNVGELYAILSGKTYNDAPMFELGTFDTLLKD